MILLVSLVPLYLVIAERARGGEVHTPELALDRLLSLTPTWALVYGALYLFLILLPVFVVQQQEMIPPHRLGVHPGVDCGVHVLPCVSDGRPPPG
jgi:hypothetical protein